MADLSALSGDLSATGPLSFLAPAAPAADGAGSASSAGNDFRTLLQSAQDDLKPRRARAAKSQHAAAAKANSSTAKAPVDGSGTDDGGAGASSADAGSNADSAAATSSDAQGKAGDPKAAGDPANGTVTPDGVVAPTDQVAPLAGAGVTGADPRQLAGDTPNKAQEPHPQAGPTPDPGAPGQGAIQPVPAQPAANAPPATDGQTTNANAEANGPKQDLQAQIQSASTDSGEAAQVIGSPKAEGAAAPFAVPSAHAKHAATKSIANAAGTSAGPVASSETGIAAVLPAAQAAGSEGLTSAVPSVPGGSGAEASPGISGGAGPMLAGNGEVRTAAASSADIARPAQDSPTNSPDPTLDQIVLGLRTKLDPQNAKAEIRLEPPNLGTLRVSVALDHGTLTAQFQTSTDVVRDLLSSHLDKLRSVLEGQGIPVDKLAVQTVNSSAPSGAADGGGSTGTNPDGHNGNGYGQGFQQPQPRENADDAGSFVASTGAAAGAATVTLAGQPAVLDLVA